MARKAIKEKCSKSTRYPNGVRYKGSIQYRGQGLWIGTFATLKEWNERRAELEPDFRRRVDLEMAGKADPSKRRITAAQFANAHVDPKTGHVTAADPDKLMWPWSHPKAKRKKERSSQVAHERLRPLLRQFGDKPLAEWTREQAHDFAVAEKRPAMQAAHQFFADAIDKNLIPGPNPFTALGIYDTKKRKDNEDFEIITEAQFEHLQECAVASRSDDYGQVIRAFIIWMGWSGARPTELFNLRHSDLDLEADEFYVPRKIDKSNKGKQPIMPPACKRAYLAMPHLSSEYVFPAPRGGKLYNSLFHDYWHPVRVLAGVPTMHVYTLKHLAVSRMVLSPSQGGLGMSPMEAAFQAGHGDDGQIVLRYYAQLRKDDTRASIKRAMQEYDRRLRLVGGDEDAA